MAVLDQLFIDSLRRSQWFSPGRMARYQAPLLEALVRHAAAHTDFHPERLRPVLRDGDLDLGRWLEVPILTRAEALARGDAMRAREVPANAGVTREAVTPGCAGPPLRHAQSALADVASQCHLDRVHELHGLDLFASCARIALDPEGRFPYPLGAKRRGWNSTGTAADLFLLDIAASPEEQLDWLARTRPTYLATLANAARSLALAALEAGGERPALRAAVVTGEVLTAEARTAIVAAFGGKAVDVYAADEVGQIAFQCPEGPGFHVCDDIVLCELLDDDGEPVGPGEIGRVVVTPLYNYAMPLIRYDLGDYARLAAEPCPCGRALQPFERVMGRRRNRLALPGGGWRWPEASRTEIAKLFPAREVQLVQVARDRVELRHVPAAAGATADAAPAIAYLKRALHPALDIAAVAVDRVEPGAGHKREPFVSLVVD